MAGEASGRPRGQGQQGREGQSRKARLPSQCRGGQEPHGEKQACRSLRWTCRGAEGRRSREGLATSTEAQVLRAVPRDHRRLMSAFRKPAGAEGRCSERGLHSPIAPRPPPPTLGTGAPLHTCFFFFICQMQGGPRWFSQFLWLSSSFFPHASHGALGVPELGPFCHLTSLCEHLKP